MMTMTKALTVHHAAITAEETTGSESVARNLLLFLAAPWVGLGYIVAFPFVGFWALLRALVLR